MADVYFKQATLSYEGRKTGLLLSVFYCLQSLFFKNRFRVRDFSNTFSKKRKRKKEKRKQKCVGEGGLGITRRTRTHFKFSRNRRIEFPRSIPRWYCKRGHSVVDVENLSPDGPFRRSTGTSYLFPFIFCALFFFSFRVACLSVLSLSPLVSLSCDETFPLGTFIRGCNELTRSDSTRGKMFQVARNTSGLGQAESRRQDCLSLQAYTQPTTSHGPPNRAHSF